MAKWTLAFEDMLRMHVFEGQLCLDELLPEEDRGDLEPVPEVLDGVRRDDRAGGLSAP